MGTDPCPEHRLRISHAFEKSFGQYEELMRGGKLRRALIIAEQTDGKYTVLGQLTTPRGALELLAIAAEALTQVPRPEPGPVARPAPRPVASTAPLETIALQWHDFASRVLGPEVGAIQRREMRRAFYAGVSQVLNLMANMFSPEEEITDLDMAKLQALMNEIEAFGDDLEQGRA